MHALQLLQLIQQCQCILQLHTCSSRALLRPACPHKDHDAAKACSVFLLAGSHSSAQHIDALLNLQIQPRQGCCWLSDHPFIQATQLRSHWSSCDGMRSAPDPQSRAGETRGTTEGPGKIRFCPMRPNRWWGEAALRMRPAAVQPCKRPTRLPGDRSKSQLNSEAKGLKAAHILPGWCIGVLAGLRQVATVWPSPDLPCPPCLAPFPQALPTPYLTSRGGADHTDLVSSKPRARHTAAC